MLKLLNPWILLAVLLGLVGSFVYGMSVGSDRANAKYAKTEALIARVKEEAQAGAASAISKIKVVNQTHKQVLEREIVSVPTGTCVLSPDGLLAINAILAPGAKPAGRGVVSSSDPAP